MNSKNCSVIASLRGWLTRGVLFAIPVWLCVVLVKFAYDLSETWLGAITRDAVRWLLPASWYQQWFPSGDIPGLSLFAAVILLTAVGAFASWHIGRQGLRIIDYLFLSTPGIRSVYSSLRKMVEAIGEPGKSRFQKVVFIDWPGKGVRTVGFVTNELQAPGSGKKQYVVFIPHTPNPTSGFVVLADADHITETEMTPEEGLRYCLSLGVLTPSAMPADQL